MPLNKPTGEMLNAAGSATPQGLGTASAGTATAYSREDHVHAIPTLSGDVTNDGLSVTVAKLQSSPVASTTPASGQVLTWDGTQWAPATNSSGGGGGANGLTYYLNQATAADAPTTGISGTPHQLGRSGEAAQTTLTSGSLTQNVWTLLAGFVSESTPIDPDVTLIPAGLWDFNVWAFGDANVNAGTSIRCSVYKYNGTTLTQIGSPSSDQVINGTSAQYSLSVLIPQTTLQLTDRIYVAIEARATGSNHNVTLEFGDSTPSHVHTSLPLVGGTGLWKSVAGVLQSPASLLVNADVDASAGIAWSKIAPSYFGSRVKVVGRDAATIQDCINLCTDADGEHPYTVLIPPIAASYSESLTLKGSVSLVGLTTPLNANAVQITGAHTFTPASTQANSNRIGFQNLTFISGGTGSNTITCSSSTKYFSKLTFSGCIFSGDKSDSYSHIKTDDNVALYVDNCRFESSAGGSASAGVTQGNGPLYFSNNTTFDVYGRALDVPASTTTTRTATVTAGSTTMTLTSGITTGLAVGMRISGANVGTTLTIVSLTAPSTVVMSSTPKTSGSFEATFGQTPYVEIHDSVLSGKGAEVVRLGNGLLTCNTSNFTNAASGSGINLLTGYAAAVGEIPAKSTTVGIVNSSFAIYDTDAYTITGAVPLVFAALNGISYSNGIPGVSFSTLINSNVTVYDYTARATSIENGGTGQITRGAALNALAGAMTANQVLAGNGTNITLRALAAADIPNLDTGKLTTGTLPVARGGTGTTAGIANINTTQIAALTTAKTANLIPQLTTSGLISLTQLSGIGTTQIAALTTAQTANLIPQLTTSGFLSLAQIPIIPAANGGTGTTAGINSITTTQLGCLTTAQVANLVPQLNSSGQIATSQIATLNQNTTGTASKATNIVGGLVGAVPYQSAVDATALLAGNTTATKKVLTQTGDGTNSAAPVWDTPTGTGSIVAGTAPTIDRPTINGFTEGVVANVTTTGAVTISLFASNFQTATLTSATACTFTMPTATTGKTFVLLLKQPASGTATTATFTGVKWPSSVAPTITPTLGRMDILQFRADGASWYGNMLGQNYTY